MGRTLSESHREGDPICEEGKDPAAKEFESILGLGQAFKGPGGLDSEPNQENGQDDISPRPSFLSLNIS